MGIGKSNSSWALKLLSGGQVVARTIVFAVVTAFIISQMTSDALAKRKGSSRGDDPSQQMEEAARESESRRKEQEKQAQEAQKQAERQRQEQEKQTRSDTPKAVSINDERGRNNNERASNDSSKSKNDDRGSNARETKKDVKANDADANNVNRVEQAAKEETPPATIKEWLGRVTEGSSGKQEQSVSPAAAPATTPAQTNNKAGGQTAKTEKPNVTKPPVSLPRIEFPEFRANEVLAVNLSSKALVHAKQMGFTVKAVTAFNASKVTVTKLEPPAGMTAVEGEAKLKQVIPSSEFALNKQYSIYRTATGTAPSPVQEKQRSTGDKSAGSACAGDHCFGREIIGWHAALNQCSRGLKIGIIDTGVDTSHAAFAGRKIEVGHMAESGSEGTTRSANWHGTGVTALLAGDSHGGVSGLSPEASFAVADAFYSGADEQPASDTLSMLRALDWLEKRDVKIINMSLSGPADELIQKAIDRLTLKGVIFVAAAGNNGPNAAPSYPAAYKNVIAVTAVNKDLAGYRYANRGDYVDFAGPGVGIWTAIPGGSGTYHSGTSFAAPFVTAAIAAVYKELPGKSADEVMRALKSRDLGAPGKDAVYGNGLVLAPETCRGGAIASASGAQSARSSFGVQEMSTQAPATQSEILPWLGFAPE